MTAEPVTVEPALEPRIRELREQVSGEVITAGDPGFDAARTGYNLRFDARPDVVVVAADAADVAAAVRFAAAAELPVAIMATGHGFARPAAGGVLIATNRMTAVTVDAEARTARVAAGARWGDVLPLASVHGLTPLHGSTTGVGAVAYTLGGGFGWLGRRFGLASDHVRSFDLVTPEGVELAASADENPEVFWALCGGGAGNLGVVTGMEIELFDVQTVYAGNLFYPAAMAPEVMRRWRDWTAGADEHLTSSVVLINFPPMEMVPAPIRGQSFVIVRGCWSGDLAAGEALVDEWRQWRAPAMDMWTPLPYAASDAISQDPTDPIPAIVTTEWFDALADEAIDILVRAATPEPGQPPALLMAEIRHAGGAIRRGAADAVNDLGRSGAYLLQMVSVVMMPELLPILAGFLDSTREALAPYVTGAAYPNLLEGEEKFARSASAFSPAHLERLRAVKADLDPQDRFRHGIGC